MSMLPKNSAYWAIIHETKKANKRARKCIACDKNKNGICLEYNRWCHNCYECPVRNPNKNI